MKHIVVTGAAGFIGCNLARRLNREGFDNLILVDHFDNPVKGKNLEGVRYSEKIDRDEFIPWFAENSADVKFVFHIGARTDTSEFSFTVLDSLNLSYSKSLWEVCTVKQVPFLYASSAATYGLGESGFSDDHLLTKTLKPLNPYGLSKQLFDLFVLEQSQAPPFWCGLKFFNVYGPYESHKGRMASVVYHAYNQILETGGVKLFSSHNPDYKDGEQLRDFVFVDDVIDVCMFFYNSYLLRHNINGIYNVGSGRARTFNDLAEAIFSALSIPPHIKYVPTPIDIRDKYQYFTEASLSKLRKAGFDKSFTILEAGIKKYAPFLKNI